MQWSIFIILKVEIGRGQGMGRAGGIGKEREREGQGATSPHTPLDTPSSDALFTYRLRVHVRLGCFHQVLHHGNVATVRGLVERSPTIALRGNIHIGERNKKGDYWG